MKSWVGIGEGRVRKSVLCGDECESVSHKDRYHRRVFSQDRIVQHIEVLELNFC